MDTAAHKVQILSEALPFIRRYHGETIVIKYGGSAMTDETLKTAFARDVSLLKLVGVNPVVVHGGGPQISKTLAALGKKSRFVDGLRYTDNDTMDVVEMVLGGLANSQIVRQINNEGGRAVGISGKDGNLLQARRLKIKKSKGDVNLGLVGQVEKIDGKVVALLDKADFIPVIAPIGVDEKGDTLNINADLVAAALAVELSAKALFLFTNTAGVLDGRGKLIAELRAAKARKLLKDGVIQGGMQPKVQCALQAVSKGISSCRIINGSHPHSLLLEIFTDVGCGTRISQ
ncbi:MAG: acetylglutamate kinase [Candidatus Zeuxoniibacter abyssi]|nr:MAG: acetylglutamate kinase [Candidatus Persebacteraceae bacterium AB1(2)]